jgi:glycosyltransferase involved in cell wall biosynthesis
VQHVIRALAAIPEHGQMLEIAGDGPQRAELEQLATREGVRCRFHGWLSPSALYPLFDRSRIFVLASSIDNFPVSLLEAMAAGCAIITTRAGGCPEVVGDAGLIVEPGDVPGLAAALTRLIHQPTFAEELGRRAARRVQDRFGWSAIASRHEAVYAEAIRGARVTSPAGELAAPV